VGGRVNPACWAALAPVLELDDVLQFELNREHAAAHHQPGPTHRDVPLSPCLPTTLGYRALPQPNRMLSRAWIPLGEERRGGGGLGGPREIWCLATRRSPPWPLSAGEEEAVEGVIVVSVDPAWGGAPRWGEVLESRARSGVAPSTGILYGHRCC
jgi:hypothetical protein